MTWQYIALVVWNFIRWLLAGGLFFIAAITIQTGCLRVYKMIFKDTLQHVFVPGQSRKMQLVSF